MGCGLGASRKKKNQAIPAFDPGQNGPAIAQSNDQDDKEEKRKKMLIAAEAREKSQKLHGMSEKSAKEFEEKRKKQGLNQNSNNVEVLNWNS